MTSKTKPRKVISVDYKDHELRVAALLSYREDLRKEILRQMAIPEDLLNPYGSTNKATSDIDQKS